MTNVKGRFNWIAEIIWLQGLAEYYKQMLSFLFSEDGQIFDFEFWSDMEFVRYWMGTTKWIVNSFLIFPPQKRIGEMPFYIPFHNHFFQNQLEKENFSVLNPSKVSANIGRMFMGVGFSFNRLELPITSGEKR